MSTDSGPRDCWERRRQGRRAFLQAGALGTLGLTLPELLGHEARANGGDQGNSVIILWMRGGPSHIDMWDPKPSAPAEYRGEFGTISTSVPGVQLTDMLPKSAAIMEKWSIIRSLTHGDPGHSTADQICFTGYPAGQNPDQNVHPSCGSIVARQLGTLSRELPTYVMVPRMVPGADAAYLGPACKPFETQSDPAVPEPFRLPNFELTNGLNVNRLGDRDSLVRSFDRLREECDTSGMMSAIGGFRRQAVEILTSDRARAAFDLDAEPSEVRERYGFQPAFRPPESTRCGAPAWSQRLLLARRLVEAGVRLVTVDLRWWDTHVLGFESLRQGFLPRFDQAYTALITDLEQRGLLKSTIVVAWGEFGRTPRVNDNAGRDHYPTVFSAAVAGGRIQGGRVLGASDSRGAYPLENPVSPQDVLCTMYRHLGIDVQQQYLDTSGRPIAVLPSGGLLSELM